MTHSYSSFIWLLVLWSLFQFIEWPNDGADEKLRIEKTSSTSFDYTSKIKGVHYFGRFRDEGINFQTVKQNNIRELVLVPYAYQPTFDNPDLAFRQRNRRRSFDRDSLYMAMAQEANRQGLKIIIKPHIWMRVDNGKWRSDISFSRENEFRQWSRNYSDFILHYARLSEKMGASHFCIGTELTGVTRGHDDFWLQLIDEVRNVYSGKIFYAANWYKEYEQINFWSHLDYIGIQAYFPICKMINPTVEELKSGWKVYRTRLKNISRKYGKPILFSELGYRSSEDAGISPWEWVDDTSSQKMKISEETQANCYEAFFQTFWSEPWFAGALIWQWEARYDRSDHHKYHTKLDFTPQNKRAQTIMAQWFGR